SHTRLPAPLVRVRVLVPYVLISVVITISKKYQNTTAESPLQGTGFEQAKWDINQRVQNKTGSSWGCLRERLRRQEDKQMIRLANRPRTVHGGHFSSQVLDCRARLKGPWVAGFLCKYYQGRTHVITHSSLLPLRLCRPAVAPVIGCRSRC